MKRLIVLLALVAIGCNEPEPQAENYRPLETKPNPQVAKENGQPDAAKDGQDLARFRRQVQVLREIAELDYRLPEIGLKTEHQDTFFRLLIEIESKPPLSAEQAKQLLYPVIRANEEYEGIELFTQDQLDRIYQEIATLAATANEKNETAETRIVVEGMEVWIHLNNKEGVGGGFLMLTPKAPK